MGYRSKYLPGNPMAAKNGAVYVHRLVMAKKLGRSLKREEFVHHIDENPENNHPDNLEILTQKEHARKHVWGWESWDICRKTSRKRYLKPRKETTGSNDRFMRNLGQYSYVSLSEEILMKIRYTHTSGLTFRSQTPKINVAVSDDDIDKAAGKPIVIEVDDAAGKHLTERFPDFWKKETKTGGGK